MQQASVAELPFGAEQFEVVTAFETVYFWPELVQNFREVYRVLKPGGIFFICNEANGETDKRRQMDTNHQWDDHLHRYCPESSIWSRQDSVRFRATKTKRAGCALRRKSGEVVQS